MPKLVDAALRRREIAEALWRIASQEGLEAVSLSRVAQEARVSKGLVQHYFSSRAEMLTFTQEHLRDYLDTRLRDRLTAIQPTGPFESVRELAAALLPVDQDGRTAALVGSAFFVRSLSQPDTAEKFRQGQAEVLRLLSDLLAQAQDAGELRADLDAEREAEILLAVIGGIGDSLLLGQHTSETAQAVLDYHFDRLAPPPAEDG
ncbi:TetR/AcrR family transcriptional regulator [Saccharopolyspora sp. 5N708]|uniref:TetR/AcrR family transcriptional regulator n=1 Tax=Saccharopolyspora sp. 5N708 TaxID=3457424 RepID=UPI003FD45AD7